MYSSQFANVAVNKPACLSSTPTKSHDTVASKAVDGIMDTDSCSRSGEGEKHPWWQVDLVASHVVHGVTITGHGDMSSKSVLSSTSIASRGLWDRKTIYFV